jgi:hypothetical protein
MGDAIGGALMAVLIVTAVIFMVILGTLFGAVAGWIVGLFFTDTILTTLGRFGVDTFGLTMWQLGATLGFIGGFFKSATAKVNK